MATKHGVSVHKLSAEAFNTVRSPRWYFSCKCGVNGELRSSSVTAWRDGVQHLNAALKEALSYYDRRLAERLKDPEFAAEYAKAQREIQFVSEGANPEAYGLPSKKGLPAERLPGWIKKRMTRILEDA